MASEKQVLAERSGSIFVGAFIGWLFAFLGITGSILVIIASRTIPNILPAIWCAMIWIVIGLLFAIYFTVLINKTPPVLAEFSDGKIYFYPKKGVEIAVNPKEIKYISQRNYSGRGSTYSSGKLIIELSPQRIELIYVREVDSVRREIEGLKEQAQLKEERQRERERLKQQAL